MEIKKIEIKRIGKIQMKKKMKRKKIMMEIKRLIIKRIRKMQMKKKIKKMKREKIKIKGIKK